jgi:hypothetical protein
MKLPKPYGFNLLTRIVFVHAAMLLAVLASTLVHALERGTVVAAAFASVGLVIACAGCAAMVGVARQRALRALVLLRWLLWLAVAKVLLGLLLSRWSGEAMTAHALLPILLNGAVLVGLAIYWSRPVHARYLASLVKA